jgi:hypothetical protein
MLQQCLTNIVGHGGVRQVICHNSHVYSTSGTYGTYGTYGATHLRVPVPLPQMSRWPLGAGRHLHPPSCPHHLQGCGGHSSCSQTMGSDEVRGRRTCVGQLKRGGREGCGAHSSCSQTLHGMQVRWVEEEGGEGRGKRRQGRGGSILRV